MTPAPDHLSIAYGEQETDSPRSLSGIIVLIGPAIPSSQLHPTTQLVAIFRVKFGAIMERTQTKLDVSGPNNTDRIARPGGISHLNMLWKSHQHH
jgi:hypothetical protein